MTGLAGNKLKMKQDMIWWDTHQILQGEFFGDYFGKDNIGDMTRSNIQVANSLMDRRCFVSSVGVSVIGMGSEREEIELDKLTLTLFVDEKPIINLTGPQLSTRNVVPHLSRGFPLNKRSISRNTHIYARIDASDNLDAAYGAHEVRVYLYGHYLY